MDFEKMFTAIDTHVAGEVYRIIIHSAINLNENSIESNQSLLKEKFADEKELLLNEPRGHRGINGCIVLPSKVADYALLFLNHDNEGGFKYGGLVTTITALLETGNLTIKENNLYEVETINGVYPVYANYKNQEVLSVQLESGECQVVEVTKEYKLVSVDKSRNYLLYDQLESIPEITMENLTSIMKWGKQTAEKMRSADVQFDGIIITNSIDSAENEIRSVTFEKDGTIQRSPGIDSTFAIFKGLFNHSKDTIQLTNESIYGCKLTANEIAGTNSRYIVGVQGFVTGMHQFIYDKDDPLENGFLLS